MVSTFTAPFVSRFTGRFDQRRVIVVAALLLAGDITAAVEPTVAAALSPGPPLVLSVPHHGSKTSSSTIFIQSSLPALALVSAGWRNRFHHPSALVMKRYDEAGVPWLNTAVTGAIQIDARPDRSPHVAATWRPRQSRYWRE